METANYFPLELWTEIFTHCRPQVLARTAQLNHEFLNISRANLYHHLSLSQIHIPAIIHAGIDNFRITRMLSLTFESGGSSVSSWVTLFAVFKEIGQVRRVEILKDTKDHRACNLPILLLDGLVLVANMPSVKSVKIVGELFGGHFDRALRIQHLTDLVVPQSVWNQSSTTSTSGLKPQLCTLRVNDSLAGWMQVQCHFDIVNLQRLALCHQSVDSFSSYIPRIISSVSQTIRELSVKVRIPCLNLEQHILPAATTVLKQLQHLNLFIKVEKPLSDPWSSISLLVAGFTALSPSLQIVALHISFPSITRVQDIKSSNSFHVFLTTLHRLSFISICIFDSVSGRINASWRERNPRLDPWTEALFRPKLSELGLDEWIPQGLTVELIWNKSISRAWPFY
ncbi:hypothetical protein DL96DRAFT_1617205 [Flagelloscypha sp. PMI_526]|nr:hypothetical protein DL96DRAFT_1617205 [Flagelloscypha sp. PMI_526]